MAGCAAINSDPTLHDLHQRGLLYLRQGNAAEAVPLLTEVADACPDAGIWNDLGSALSRLGRIDDALIRLQGALALQPDCLPAYANLGKVLVEHGRADVALPLLRRALAFDPDFVAVRAQLANALLESGNRHLADDSAPQAEQSYREALQHRPHFAEAASNLGTALTAQNRLREAIDAYRAALALRPGHANTEFAFSLALLLNGDFTEGWRRFEARRQATRLAANYQRRPEVPRCRPQDLLTLPAGRTILLLAEQGFGDMIQYVRYVPLLQQRGFRIILEAQPELQSLFTNLGVPLIGPDDPTPDCAAACFLLSLPFAFASDLASLPANTPYLRARTLPRDPRRIGLAVAGDPIHPHDRQRSIPLEQFAPLFAAPGRQFTLVQRDVRDADRNVAVTHGIGVPTLHDFAATASLLSTLELLITVDTSVAHLAGALGVEVWLLLRFSPDYRWLLGRNDSPWYPSMRLYRQQRPGDWAPVIEAVRRDLR